MNESIKVKVLELGLENNEAYVGLRNVAVAQLLSATSPTRFPIQPYMKSSIQPCSSMYLVSVRDEILLVNQSIYIDHVSYEPLLTRSIARSARDRGLEPRPTPWLSLLSISVLCKNRLIIALDRGIAHEAADFDAYHLLHELV